MAAWVAVPFVVGFALRTRHEAAVRMRADALRRGAAEERLRVAQEVHDIVGHGLAAIKMQADIALHVLARRPEQAEKALEAISRTNGTALEELRTALAVVREPGTGSDRAPAAGLARLEELRRRMAEAGVAVRLETAGEPRGLPDAVDLAGYRIVQESLTNVLRHSAAARATVRIGYEDGGVRVTVTSPLTGAAERTGGSGVEGMRGRVRSLGGEFTAGPASGDRFVVDARLPAGGRP